MNYLKEINAFQDWLETHPIPPPAIALWYGLMGIANKAYWPEDLTVPISALQTRAGCGRDAVYAARKALKAAGRIDYTERPGRLSAVYRLIPFVSDKSSEIPTQEDQAEDIVSDKSTKKTMQSPTQTDFVSEVASENPSESPTIYKQRQNSIKDTDKNSSVSRTKSTRKKKGAKSSDREGTQAYAEYVYLKPTEYKSLCTEYGAASAVRMVEILDSFKGSKGKEYVDDYRAIKNWVVNRWREEQPRAGAYAPNTTRTLPSASSHTNDDDFFSKIGTTV